MVVGVMPDAYVDISVRPDSRSIENLPVKTQSTPMLAREHCCDDS